MTELRRWLEPGMAAMAVGEGPARAAALRVVAGFAEGARVALEHDGAALLARLDALPPVAWEGAGLIAAEHDAEDEDGRRRPGRLAALLSARPDRGVLLCIGHGWSRALRRLPAEYGPASAPAEARWWSVDGHGFFLGLLRSRHVLAATAALPDDADTRELFDRGVGRSLWYRHAGDVRSIAHVIARLGERAASLWCGVGVASVFSGGLAALDASSRAELSRRGGQALRVGAAMAGLSAATMHGSDFDAAVLRERLGVDLAPVRAALPGAPDGRLEYGAWRAALAAAVG